MGHQHLYELPDTAPWRRVVGLLAEEARVEEIAQATTEAALRGLALAHGDEGLVHSVWLLAHIATAARQPDFETSLRDLGLKVTGPPGLYDLVGGFSDAVDDRLRSQGRRTDLGELAQLAAVESLCALLGPRAESLYGTTPVEVQQAVREFSTRNGFALLAHEFFSRFTQRFLTYHLGRELSQHVGGNGRFANPAQLNEFVDQLALHSRQAALIVRDFAGGWYSVAWFETGITVGRTRYFVNRSLNKLREELKVRGERDD